MWIQLFVFILILKKVLCDDDTDEETQETLIVETTTQQVYVHTDIPASDVDAALNLDFGNYTTMRFNYINSQFDNLYAQERCYDDYIKCLLTQVAPTPVCAYNNFIELHGFLTASSYCDIHFDSCRRTVRFWRILDYGTCEQLKQHTQYPKYIKLGIPETLREALAKTKHFSVLPSPHLDYRHSRKVQILMARRQLQNNGTNITPGQIY
ncbi:uncharacterized protein LOC123720341 isoform X2 [Pieris brassicae]|uniref:Uncharacterized protein n=1 Tax=Pieris brassicae TaxID=7116 RepID=A0A9P0TVS4_PIEBR|nr:uncharacterized protein LOC123720341 isoform X2 [Pieris brassicae]CAH4037063.1 unnamed protein product [Pieris brassicae]